SGPQPAGGRRRRGVRPSRGVLLARRHAPPRPRAPVCTAHTHRPGRAARRRLQPRTGGADRRRSRSRGADRRVSRPAHPRRDRVKPLGALAAPVLRAFFAPRAAAFERALGDVAGAQRRVLGRIVRACAATAYGRSLGLTGREGVEEFRARAPLVDYDTVEPWILRQRAEGGAVI